MSNNTLGAMLKAAMDELAAMNASGINIHGKRYTTVAKRIEVFRKHFGLCGRIRILHADIGDEAVVMHAAVDVRDESGWFEVAQGHAEERRTSSQINRTSAVENCETSAIGRALACLGLHGGEYASANEVENAVHQQLNPTPAARQASPSAGPSVWDGSLTVSSGKHKGKAWRDVPLSYIEWCLEEHRDPLPQFITRYAAQEISRRKALAEDEFSRDLPESVYEGAAR